MFRLKLFEKKNQNAEKNSGKKQNEEKNSGKKQNEEKNSGKKQNEERLFCSEKCVEKYKKNSDIRCCYCHKNFLKYNGVISGNKMFCSTKCYRDDRNSIKEIEGGEDNDEENEENIIKNNNNYNETGSINEIDILDI